MMNPEVKANWVASLRSDRYEQGSGLLRTADNKFCCLGVLCDILPGVRWDKASDGLSYVANYGDESATGYVPSELGENIGLSREIEYELTAMNDGVFNDESGKVERKSFAEIADHIEGYL